MTVEVNFDGLVGPTHNYAGLSLGNRASMGNAGGPSDPRRAARQGLTKMRRMLDLGLTQAVLPPQRRPDPAVLSALGFPPGATVADVAAAQPELVPTVMSASAMWVANAATVSPSADTADGRVHLTPANLASTTHRGFEAARTAETLRRIFGDGDRFTVHDPLPATAAFADEGAANHGRLADGHGAPGTHVFVFGREANEPVVGGRFPRRQTRLAGATISRSHGHRPKRVHFVRQSAAAIEAGAFHNDVVSVVNETVWFTHEQAFDRPAAEIAPPGATMVVVPAARVPLEDAIGSYLFNSQLVTLPDGSMTLIAPIEVREHPSTAAYLDEAVDDPDHPVSSVQVMDLRQSMRNGGGPACLRLRVALRADELAALGGRVVLDHALLDDLDRWVDTHYRSELRPDDLADPALAEESDRALDELERLFDLPGLYGL